jgi:hypothetical protein
MWAESPEEHALSRLRSVREALASSPLLRGLSRLLTLAAGALLVVGPLQPWTYVPIAGLRLPYYGLFGIGGLALVAGLLLLLRSSPGPLLLLAIAAGAWYLAAVVPPQMMAGAHGTLVIAEAWLDPLNQLLDRFHIAQIRLADWSLPAAHTVGPGVRTTLWGAGFAAAAALSSALAHPPPPVRSPRSCPACAARLSHRRELHFCPHCGEALGAAPVCRACATVAVPGDQFCGRCGARLLGG